MDTIVQNTIIIGVTSAVMFALNSVSDARKIKAAAVAKKLEKEEDYKRQDEVAKKVAEAAEAAKKTAQSTELLAQSNQVIAEASKVQVVQMAQIHELVNSSYTAAKEGELAANKSMLALLEEMAVLLAAQGKPPSVRTTTLIESTVKKIHEIETELADRLAKTRATDAAVLKSQHDVIASRGVTENIRQVDRIEKTGDDTNRTAHRVETHLEGRVAKVEAKLDEKKDK